MKLTPRSIVLSGLIAAIYTALTLLLQPFGYGPVQFRLAEALTVLPALVPASVPGLVIGCFLANWLGGFGLVDMVFGSLATLLAGLCTYLLRDKRFLYPLPPVIFNGVIVGSYVYLLYDKTYPWLLTMLFIAISEAVLTYGVGLPLLSIMRKNRGINQFLDLDK
jgi:uncharacterized membrane protein